MPEKNILVADDDEMIRELFMTVLGDEGYQIYLASDGKAAVDIAKNSPIDVAILDIKMPVMDGLEALERIKEIDESIEVIILTGYGDLESLRQMMVPDGAFDYLLKPADIPDIKHCIRRAIGKRDLVTRNNLAIRELKDRIHELERDFERRTLELRESQIKYKNIVQNVNDGIVVIQDEYLKFANRRAVETLGYTMEEILNTPFLEMIYPGDRAMVEEIYKKRLRDEGAPPVHTFRVLKKDRSLLWVESRAVKTMWGERPAALNVMRDISERIEAQEALRESEEVMIRSEKLSSLGQLSAGLAHELRNPLAVISSCSQFCLDNMRLERLLKENFQVIYRNAKKASKLINDLLEFARPSDLDWMEIDMNEVITRMSHMAALEARSSHITFVSRLRKRLPKVMGDEEKLGQAFLNIIQNAVQAVSGKGKIILQTKFLASQDLVEATVIDDGPGIPEDYRSRIFDPFFTTKDRGTGLGLSICHSVVEQHKGSIIVDSGDGGGTRVSVRLPLNRDDRRMS